MRLAAPLALAGGLILDLAYPSVGWWPAAIIAASLGLVTLIGRSVPGALAVGLAFGAGFFPLHLVWVGEFLGPLPWVALAALQAVLFAAGAVPIALAYRLFPPRRGGVVLLPLLVAGLWTLRELIMGTWPYTGFPWARIGLSQVDGPFAQVASWTGTGGLSFLVVALCASAIEVMRARAPRRTLVPLAAGVALALLPAFPTTPAGELRMGWVQANGPSAYFDERAAGDLLAAHFTATDPLLDKDVDLLVWPEGAVDSDPLSRPATAAVLDDVVGRAGAPLLANAATQRGDDTYNTSLLWTGEGAPQLHDKANPVPFGEYVPDRWLYQAIAPDLIGLIQREYTPGANPPVVTVGGVELGLAICFDVIYDDVIRAGALGGAEAYVFQTNNADFRGTDENLQQLAIARMRAIEAGRAVANISTTGTSQIVAPDGTVLDGAAAGTTAARVSEVPLRTGLTPAVVLGSWPTVLAAAGALVALLLLGVTRRRAALRLDERNPS
ncbi:apolipoprotein N-acyltransferase [Microbacterium oryzae]|uniref:Apolipoprotein N-acyltransferase n=2 Tax=Microbacterium oryzae TaxID=743009 RepID=A0A6I6E3X8_9MICO|nr:apolipoprotein N-acyltransferase [Microbacterium oryzae]QGU28874.1 apolipoprotein N-acyltransferase [Microbacterium oryzae]